MKAVCSLCTAVRALIACLALFPVLPGLELAAQPTGSWDFPSTVYRSGAKLPATQEITISLPGSVPLVLVWTPAGTFQMDSPESERGRDPDEGPQHEVNVGHDFYVGGRVLRSGHWHGRASACRSANRSGEAAGFLRVVNGFRVARSFD